MGAPEVTIDVEPATGIWRTDGVPMIYLPRHFLVNNHKATEEALGRDAYSTMIRTATDKSAFDWCTIQSQRSSNAPEDVFRLYFERLSQRGWGRFSIESMDVDTGRVSLRLHHSVFVLEEKQTSAQMLCYMFEGFVTGALRFLYGGGHQTSAFSCHETQCAGDLHSDFCRFEARCDPFRPG
jgi:predicted hydrocarbon binding protein